jgi:hypothetical protein
VHSINKLMKFNIIKISKTNAFASRHQESIIEYIILKV